MGGVDERGGIPRQRQGREQELLVWWLGTKTSGVVVRGLVGF